MERQIKFVCNAVKWFDRINGNTYHSVRITRCSDGKVIVGQFQYGYGEHYRHTAICAMIENNWIDSKYKGQEYLFERENHYPILWNVSQGLKRECVSNGVL